MTAASRTAARRIDPWLVAGFVLAAVMWVLVLVWSDPSVQATAVWNGRPVTAQDARSYWGFNYADLYAGRTDWNGIGAYPYSPVFAQLLFPLNLLPWPLFVAVWTAILIAAVWFLTGPDYFLLGLVVGAMEIAGGNISLLLALAIVKGFRHPWTWSLVLLTKITPGVGLLWFVVRREWRQLAIALGATAALAAVSFVLMPQAWRDWVDLLRANTGKGGTWAAIPIPLLVRGPIGVLLIVWGARRNQRWTVPAVIPLTTREERARAWARVTRRATRSAQA